MSKPKPNRFSIALPGLVLGLAGASILAIMNVARWPLPQHVPPPKDRPIQDPAPEFVTSDQCRSCHPREYGTWHDSWHRTMTQVATPETVIPDMDGITLGHRGKTYRVEKVGRQFWAELDDPDWSGPENEAPRVRRQIVMTTGAHHEQDFWFATGHSRVLGRFPFVYRIAEQQWIPDGSVLLGPPDSPPYFGDWNTGCINCHTTIGRSRVSGIMDMDTRVSEFGIACEACHGPAERHVAANRDPARRYRIHAEAQGDPTIVNPARLPADRASQVCGQCHSIWDFDSAEDRIRRDDHGIPFRPGDDLHEAVTMIRFQESPRRPVVREALAKNPDFLRERFWSDGMVRASGREYTAMIESPCFNPSTPDRPRVSCLSCHGMHQSDEDQRPVKVWADDQLQAGMRSNDACVQCHAAYADATTLTAHTWHQENSTGSLCYNCHMPHTTFGLLKGIRSHQISVPTVRESLSTGRPNACNHCHLDQTLSWTADHLFERYKQPVPDMTVAERETAASVLWLVKGEAGQRALTAWLYGWEPARTVSGEDWMPPVLAQSLFDPYDAVRFIGAASLRKIKGFEDLDYQFVGPAEHRTDTARRVIARWNAAGPENRRRSGNRSQVLILDSGEFDFARFEALYHQRDNRRIHIAE